MSFRISCPGCKTAMKLDDDARGTKVRCDNCNKTLTIPGSNGKKSGGDERAVQEGRKLKNAASHAEDDEPENEDQEEERPSKKKKKKKKKKGSSMGLLIGGGAAVAVLLIVVVRASAYFMTRSPNNAKNEQLAKNNDKKGDDGGAADGKQPDKKNAPVPLPVPVPVNPDQDKIDKEQRNQDRIANKGGKSFVGNIRAAGARTGRLNELKQIGTFYQQFCLTAPKSARNKVAFLEYIKIDSKAIHEAISDDYYTINFRADDSSSNTIIAFESYIDGNGMYMAVRGDLSVGYAPPQDINNAKGK